jgi:hypothetical protein
MCETFIIWNEVWFPCCGSRLRIKPKNTVDRRRAARDLSIAYNNMPQLIVLLPLVLNSGHDDVRIQHNDHIKLIISMFKDQTSFCLARELARVIEASAASPGAKDLIASGGRCKSLITNLLV